MSDSDAYKVNVVAYEADGVWFAQCIEFDVSAWAEHLPDLPDAITKQITATCMINRHLGRRGLEGIPPAPAHFREMLKAAPADLRPRPTPRPHPVQFDSFGIVHQAA
jgi:hypothetical protein